jgi:glutamate racemase
MGTDQQHAVLATDPVGFFDSGVGGLSVMQAARRILPCENMLYFADAAHCPYGSKGRDFVQQRSLEIARFMRRRGAKALVVACNSASEAALDMLRQVHPGWEIIGVEPALKVAQGLSRNKKIGVLGTPLTLKGRRFSRLLENFSAGAEVYTQPVAGLVELIENGRFDDPGLDAILKKNLRPLLDRGVDTVVLGCTHYPLLAPAIAAICGPRVELIDTGAPVARQLQRRLERLDRLNPGPGRGRDEYFSSGRTEDVRRVVARVMADPAVTVRDAGIG